MTREFLVPSKNRSNSWDDPYTPRGARNILRRFKPDVIAMLDFMLAEEDRFSDQRLPTTMLAGSPLRNKPYVAGTMKTLGLVTEHPTRGGACALALTPKARKDYKALKQFL